MLQDYSKENVVSDAGTKPGISSLRIRLLKASMVVGWVFVSFVAAQLLLKGILLVLRAAGVSLVFIDSTVLSTIIASVIYIVTLVFAIGIPRLVKKQRTSLQGLGLSRLPVWSDIFLAPAGLVVYFILSVLIMMIARAIFPGFDASQVQDTGFTNLNYNYEYAFAFLTLVVIAPIAEETIFRGYLFGRLKKYVPLWLAIVITSMLFGAVHGAWNLALDTFALSVVLCVLRESTNSLWASILLHMTKNGIAFYLLFINPILLHTLGG
jgi:membrane protease YdiL (CAAX protease family)